MNLKIAFCSILLASIFFNSYAQNTSEEVLAEIQKEGLENSKALSMLSEFTDVYGQRLTGSREYFAAAKWVSRQMEDIGLENVHFENYCQDCRGWGIKSFNVEMIAPNYMHLSAFPLAMTKSTNGIVEGELIHISSYQDIDLVKGQLTGKLKGKIVLLGAKPTQKSLLNPITSSFSDEQLKAMEDKTAPTKTRPPLPELLESWDTGGGKEQQFLQFIEAEGALAVLNTRPSRLGIMHPDGTYYYKEDDFKPLPFFTIMSEHFGRLLRLLEQNVVPKIRLNLDTEFYMEPDNNVNILGEISGSDAKLKSETVMIGAHFDSWHSGTGAMDNGANSIVLVEAMRILKAIGYTPKRTLKIGLWGGEEQALMGSVAYGKAHFGDYDQEPSSESKRMSAYLNLDNGAGLIRGVHLQNNTFAKPIFEKIFNTIPDLTDGVLTIDNTFNTDHFTFDYYNIPAFQFIQDHITQNVTAHTNLDLLEYVPEKDIRYNATILASIIYNLSEMEEKVPRKLSK